MSEKNIFILTGPVHSGKTTFLQKLLTGRKDVCGILSPVINGKRVFLDIASRSTFDMEADENEDAILIGRYRFSKKSFTRAEAIISNNLLQKDWLVIDEVGPLELRKEGFYDVVHKAIARPSRYKLILVIRETLLNEIIKFFQITNYKLFTVEDEIIL